MFYRTYLQQHMLHKAHILTLFRNFHKYHNHAAARSVRLISSDCIENNCSQNLHSDRHDFFTRAFNISFINVFYHSIIVL